jgi:hypothetical protein
MPKLKKAAKKQVKEKTQARVEPLRSEEKIARLLGILAIQNVKWKPGQAYLLRSAGFGNSEIAEMLDVSSSGASDLIYKYNKGKNNDTGDQS